MKKEVTVISEGTRVAADLFIPDDIKKGEKRPAILLCNGWGGGKHQLEPAYADYFCKRGFVALAFDYRGWYKSDPRVVVEGPVPKPDENGYVTVRARTVNEVVDPFEQYLDCINCLDFLDGEESVDPDRLGVWGTSYGAGHAINLAGNDYRIKCLVSQVGAPNTLSTPEIIKYARRIAREKAHGLHGVLPAKAPQLGNLLGTPESAKMPRYRPIDVAYKIKAPSLFMDQDGEEYADYRNQYPEVIKRMDPSVPVHYHTFSGSHYEIYSKNYRASSHMACDWFLKYL